MTAPRWRAWLLEGKRLYWRFGCWYVPRSDEILHHRSKTADSRPIANTQGGKRLLFFLPCDGPEMPRCEVSVDAWYFRSLGETGSLGLEVCSRRYSKFAAPEISCARARLSPVELKRTYAPTMVQRMTRWLADANRTPAPVFPRTR